MIHGQKRSTLRTLAGLGWLAIAQTFLAGVAVAGDGGQSPSPLAVDDHVVLAIGTASVTVSHAELRANDHAAFRGVVSVERAPIHGALVESADRLEYTPRDDFWAIGSDLIVYRLDTSGGTSYATLYLVAERRRFVHVAEFGFEDPSDLPNGATPGLAIETVEPLVGKGSLAVRVSDPGDDVHGTLVLPEDTQQAGPGNPGEVDACAGGFASIVPYGEGEPEDAAGYLLLLGHARADIHTAAVRVGVTRGSSDLFVEVRESGTAPLWHRSAILDRGNEVVRLAVAFAESDGYLSALLRADGLAVRTPRVAFSDPLPTHARIGFFQPEMGGSTADLLYDLVHLGTEAAGAPGGDTGRLLAADDFEDDTLDAWTASYGTGLVTSSASALSGDVGLGVSGLGGGPSFLSFRTRPVGQTPDPRFRRLTARTSLDVSSFSLEPGYTLAPISIHSGDSPLFGDVGFRLEAFWVAGRPNLGLLLYDGGEWVTSGSVSVAVESALELQVGRADGPGLDNGWARLWVDGAIAHQVYRLDNHQRELRSVHFGAEAFLPYVASGTLRFDDAAITR